MKKVVITGANRGIGLALVSVFIEAGFYVVATTRNKDANLIEHPNLNWITLDLTKPELIHSAVAEIRTKCGTIDLLINNAGVGLDLGHALPQMDLIRSTFEVNLFGLVHFTETILDVIGDEGTIFNISSVKGMLNRDRIAANATAYRMSKAALNMYTRTLATRLVPKQISVNSIHPGWVKTDMGGVEADISASDAAQGIYNLYQQKIETNTFWAAVTQTQLNW